MLIIIRSPDYGNRVSVAGKIHGVRIDKSDMFLTAYGAKETYNPLSRVKVNRALLDVVKVLAPLKKSIVISGFFPARSEINSLISVAISNSVWYKVITVGNCQSPKFEWQPLNGEIILHDPTMFNIGMLRNERSNQSESGPRKSDESATAECVISDIGS